MADYFVDQTLGVDGAAGTELAPWETISKVNGESFSAGDSISFKRGERWREELTVPDAGSVGNVITFGAYSTGAAPEISGADVISSFSAWTGVTGNLASLDFEENDLTDFTSTTTQGSTTIATSTTKVKAGTYSVKLTADTSDRRVYGTQVIAAMIIGDTYWFRYYMYMDASQGQASASMKMNFTGGVSNGNYNFVMDGSGDIASFNFWDGTQTVLSEAITFNTGAWNLIEFSLKCHATVGGAQLWINNVSIASDFTKDTSNLVDMTTMTFGNNNFGTGLADGGIVYFDAIEISDVERIGPLAGANEYSKSLAADPDVLIVDDIVGIPVADPGSLSSDKEWYYDSGSTTLYIKSTSDPSGRTIEGGARTNCIDTNNKDYLDFDTLVLYGSKMWGGGLAVNASIYIGVTDCDLSRNGFAGLLGKENDWGRITATNCDFSYNGVMGVAGWAEFDAHVTVGNSLFTTCNYFENGWAAVSGQAHAGVIGAFPDSEFSGGSCYNNGNYGGVEFDSFSHGMYLGKQVATDVGYHIHDMTVYGHQKGNGIKLNAVSGTCEYNYCHTNGYGGISAGYNEGATVNTYVQYNLCTGNGRGITQLNDNSGTTNLYLYNNVCWHNYNTAKITQYTREIDIADDLNSLVGKNNILVGNTDVNADHMEFATGTTQAGMDWDYNCLQHAKILYVASKTWEQWQALGFDVNGINEDPLLTDPGSADFTLQTTSPCKDAGVDVSLTQDYAGMFVPQGNVPDIGAFELAAITGTGMFFGFGLTA